MKGIIFAVKPNNPMKTVLHLSYDYAGSGKTTVVKDLIKATQALSIPRVISLDRVINMRQEYCGLSSKGELIVKTFGLPFGLFLVSHLRRAFHSIQRSFETHNSGMRAADVIHAHKLTYEGYIGYLLSQKLDIPLLVSLRQTDFRVLRYRPDLRQQMRKILKHCKAVFFVAPYMQEAVRNLMGVQFFEEDLKTKLIFLPNIVDRKVNSFEIPVPRSHILIVVRMTKKSVKRKNLENLFKALSMCEDLNCSLNVIGDGTYIKVVNRWAEKFKIAHKVRFLGAIPNTKIDRYYAESMAFVMPSFSETFGLVYAEALLNGTPILYSQGTGFDGMFKDVGVAVNPHSPASIEQGLREILHKNVYYREVIRNLQKANAFGIFSPEYAKDTYSKVLNKLN